MNDATGKTVGEIREMGRWDRYATALVRARFYRERNREAEKAQNKM